MFDETDLKKLVKHVHKVKLDSQKSKIVQEVYGKSLLVTYMKAKGYK